MIIYSKENECLINLPKNQYWAITVDKINEKWGIVLKSDCMMFLLKSYGTYNDAKETIEELIKHLSYDETIVKVL